jgi:hypothetical protein
LLLMQFDDAMQSEGAHRRGYLLEPDDIGLTRIGDTGAA